ncbi:hypothetical protein U1Q18_008296 [Sarracenia purpurea var. burkii]
MAKKKTPKRKKREDFHEIDHIPKCWQQPRSRGGPRRRTDFSLFFWSSYSSLSNGAFGKGLLPESSSSKDKLTSATITDLEETRDNRNEILELPVAQCRNFQDKRRGLFSNIVDVPVIEVESVTPNALFEAWSVRNGDKQRNDMVGKLEFIPDKSQITESSNFGKTPGSAVWGKTACQLCYPAEALHQRECQSPGKELIESSDDPNCSIQRDQSPDKWNSSSSSRTENDSLMRRRGKRERKPKVHFDDVTFPLKSVRKVRRFRIMRFLGLAAPVGSPFQ